MQHDTCCLGNRSSTDVQLPCGASSADNGDSSEASDLVSGEFGLFLTTSTHSSRSRSTSSSSQGFHIVLQDIRGDRLQRNLCQSYNDDTDSTTMASRPCQRPKFAEFSQSLVVHW